MTPEKHSAVGRFSLLAPRVSRYKQSDWKNVIKTPFELPSQKVPPAFKS